MAADAFDDGAPTLGRGLGRPLRRRAWPTARSTAATTVSSRRPAAGVASATLRGARRLRGRPARHRDDPLPRRGRGAARRWLRGSGVSAWLSLSCDAGRTRAGEDPAEAFAMAADVDEIFAVGVNCTDSNEVAALSRARSRDVRQAGGRLPQQRRGMGRREPRLGGRSDVRTGPRVPDGSTTAHGSWAGAAGSRPRRFAASR